MKLKYVNRGGGAHDITQVMASAVWSGDYAQAARSLEVAIPVNAGDPYLPKITVGLGEMLVLYSDGGAELFRGYAMRQEAPAAPGVKTILAYDGLRYVARREITRNWKGNTAEEVTRDVCAELGVEVGGLADSGGARLSLPWLGKSAWRAVVAAWTRASDGTGRQYQALMREGRLHVVERGAAVCARELSGRAEISDAKYVQSIEDMVNRVIILDKGGNKTGEAGSEDDARLYGVMQKAYRQEDGKDARAEAEKLLAGVANTATLEDFEGGEDCLDMVTGNAVLIREPVSGLVGKFYIDSDKHTFEDGRHTVNLGLNFKLVMDREEAEQTKRIRLHLS